MTAARADLRRAALLLLGGGMLFGLVLTIAGVLVRGIPFTAAILIRETLAWVSICSTAPLVLYFAERVQRRPRAFRIAAHSLGFLTVLAAHTVIFNGLLLFAFGGKVHWIQQVVNLVRYDALLYPLVVLAASITRQRRLTRHSELASARIARRVAQAQLDEVRLRLDPDEVAGELAAIEEAMAGDAAGAEDRLYALSRSLRKKLERIALPARPRRAHVPPPPFNVRHAVLMLASAFACYLTALMVVLRLVNRIRSWRDLITMFIVFVLSGLGAAAAIPLYRGAFPWRARTLARRLSGIAMLLVFCLAQGALAELIMMVLRRFDIGRPAGWMFDFVLILSMVMLYVVAYDDLKLLQRESRLDAERLASALAEARLRSLRTQIAPHFLFNALNSVMSLLRQDVAGARQMLVRLRALMRVAADHRERQEVTLAEDLEMTRSYLEIEKVRFRDAIDVDVDVDETLCDAYVPAFLLQPLVENAVRHGALASLGHGTVRVSVARDHGSMAITVSNDGELLDPSGWREGIGLSSTRARLAQMYGDAGALTIDAAVGAVSVGVRLPLRLRK